MKLEEQVKEMGKRYDNMTWSQAVIYADRHTGIESLSSDTIMKNYIADNKKNIRYIIDLGDGIDNPFMSNYPVNPEFILSAQEEFDLYARHLKELDDLVPRAKKIIIAGNHDKARLNNSKKLNRGLAGLRNLEYENVLKEALTNIGAKVNRFILADPTYEIQFTKSYKSLFTHGDPRLNPNIKGGVTGIRRTAETYPFDGNIYMGHGHWFVQQPRRYNDQHTVMLGGLFDIESMKKLYINHHPYENGFGVIKYNKKNDLYVFNYVPIIEGRAVVDGKTYKA